jgi:serine/threonine protein kinase
MVLAVHERLGHYDVLAPLGAGGMGEVYRARDTRLDRTVALKILPEGFATDPDRLARFEREAKALAALSHPGILAVHDFGVHERTAYVVTELLEGQTLRQRLARGALPQRKAVEYAAQIAGGLAAAGRRMAATTCSTRSGTARPLSGAGARRAGGPGEIGPPSRRS